MGIKLHGRASLGDCRWTFAGYIGEEWRFRNAWVTAETTRPWHEATVPGSVHWDLLRAGLIDDPYLGQNSLAVEWVPERNWVYRTSFEVPADWDGRRTFLVFEGVDYEAEVFVDGEHVGTTTSLFAPATFEVDLAPGSHDLVVAIDEAPREEPQIGRTSLVRTRKPRMSYGWDFAPRLVHLGIWAPVHLVSTGPVRIDDLWVRPTVDAEARTASVEVTVTLGEPAPASTTVDVEITRNGASAATTRVPVEPGATTATATIALSEVALWWPNGMGEQALYECTAVVRVGDDSSDATDRTFGLRSLRLVHNQGPNGPRTDALPYTFEVNGRPFFAKGWNWVPVDSMYGRGDLTERYTELVGHARDAHANLLRAWGGGLVEREIFYDLCDRAGILVWQELIQSSSGMDNDPPVEPGHLAALVAEAAPIVRSRRNHPSLALWCGGNELAVGADQIPVTIDHPNVAALAAVVREHDPDRPFVPTSPTGPIFFLSLENALSRPDDHHAVHGPWDHAGAVRAYATFNASPALFHGEFGTPGAVTRSSLDRFVPAAEQWPPDETNPVWLHHGSWWLQKPSVDSIFGPTDDLDTYLLLTQWLQADLLAYTLDANRRRWPTCSGNLPWQLNEPWPNAHCTSSIDYHLRPKPAYWAVRTAYAPVAVSLRHEGIALEGKPLDASVWVTSDVAASGEATVTVHRLDGTVLAADTFAFTDIDGSQQIGALTFDLEEAGVDLVVVRTEITGQRSTRRHTAFGIGGENAAALRPLHEAPATALTAETAPGRLVLHNDGPTIAPMVVLDIEDDALSWRFGDNATLLLPGESWEVDVTAHRRAEPLGPHRPFVEAGPEPTEVHVDVRCWNTPAMRVTVPLA